VSSTFVRVALALDFVVVVVDGDRIKLKPLENGDGTFYAHCDEW